MQDYQDGGLKMPVFSMVVKAAKIKWIQQFLDANVQADWKSNFEYFCQKSNLSLFIQSNFELKEIPMSAPKYYQDSIKYWREIKNDKMHIQKLFK